MTGDEGWEMMIVRYVREGRAVHGGAVDSIECMGFR